MLTDKQILMLLNKSEAPYLDFKGGEYDLSSPRGQKGRGNGYLDLVKDILCMSNTRRKESAFIFTGIVNGRGYHNRISGIRNRIDDSGIQSLLKRWLYPTPQVHYYESPIGNKRVGVFEIMRD